MRRLKSVFLPGAAAIAVLALWILARTDDPIPNSGLPSWTEPGAFSAIRSDHPEFENLFALIRTTLRSNQTAFNAPSGLVRGFIAGSAYPQIWIRDAAAIIPASRYFYGRPYLRSNLIECLRRQKADGSLQDWFDNRGSSGKNTTESDQETSAVLTAVQIADLTGADWLRENVDGATILDRLERGLAFVGRERFEPALGLIKNAHTIDWGDVEMEEPDQRAVQTGPNTHWTAGIYSQSQFYAAALKLADMFRRCGAKEKAVIWTNRAKAVQEATDRFLWQETKGYYRVHAHITPLSHAFDEDGMFAMGGNAEAILSGLASPDKARRIFETALARQKEFRISTISGVLLPPYAKGVFAHPLVDRPYEYQNGGQWDWQGGKLLLAMFQNGRADDAALKLLEIGRKNSANRGFYEWDAPNGAGRGSACFLGSAGSLSRALVEGYYGIEISAGRLNLTPRLGADRGAIHVYFPAAERYAAYEYEFDEEFRALTVSYASDWMGEGNLRLLWPQRGKNGGPLPPPIRFIVQRDGAALPYRIERIGEDAYICLNTDWKEHVLRIRPDAGGQSSGH